MKISKTFLVVALFLSASVLFMMNGIQTNPVASEWMVSPSDDVSYLVEESTWDVSLDNVDFSGIGGYFEGITVNKGTTFDVEVLSVDDELGVTFRVDNSTDTVSATMNNDKFLFEFLNLIYYPYQECDRLTHFELDLDQVVFGPEILGWFFLEANTDLWDFLEELTTEAYHTVLPFYDQFNVLLQADFVHEENLAIFDMFMNGSFENETEGTSVDFGHSIKFVWDNTTGILQGYRISSATLGTYQNHPVEISLQAIIKEVSYDLPDFKFLTALFPGFEYLTAIAVFSTIILSQLVFKKFKQKKRTSK